MVEFISSKWFSLFLNISLCAIVLAIGLIRTKTIRKESEETGSYQLRAYIPTIWTSLGILGTFVSILISLFIYTQQGTDNINGLIYNIAPAFTTSIIGIIGSILTSIKNKQYLANIEKNEADTFKQHQFNNRISSKGDSYSPEMILLEILKEIKDSKQKSIDDRGRLINKLETHLKKNSDNIEAVQNSLGGKIDSLSNKIGFESNTTRNTFSEALKVQKDDFKDTVEKIKTKFDSTLREQNTILENKLNTLNTTLGSKIESMNTKMDGAFNRLIDATEKSLASESEKRNNELIAFINEVKEKATGFINDQTKLYADIYDKFDITITDIRKLFEEDVKQTIEQFAEEQHAVSVEALAQWNSKLSADADNALKEHSETMRNNMHELDEKTKETYASFCGNINDIAKTVANKLQELYDRQIGLIGNTIENNREQVETSLSENRNSIQTILDANKEALRIVSEEIKTDNGEMKQGLTKAQNEWKKEALRIEGEHLDEVKKIHTDTEKDIQGILTKITNYESSIQQSLYGIKEELTNSVLEFKKSIRDIEQFIIDNNKGLHTDLRQQIHDAFQINELEVACEKLREGVDSTLNSLNTNTNEINSSLSAINKSLDNSSKKYIDTVVNSNDLLTYINETLQVNKQNITSVAVILSEIDTLNKTANQIEENIQRIQSLQSSENDKVKHTKGQEK